MVWWIVRLHSRTMQTFETSQWTIVCIVGPHSMPLPALEYFTVDQCLHWYTLKFTNARRLYSRPMSVLGGFLFAHCWHWATLQLSNASIQRLYNGLMLVMRYSVMPALSNSSNNFYLMELLSPKFVNFVKNTYNF